MPTGHEVSSTQGLPMYAATDLFSLVASEPLFTPHMMLPLTETWKDPLREVHCDVAGPLCCLKGVEETKMQADEDYPALKCGETDSVTLLRNCL